MTDTDINFYFDPVCPFAWMTSKWVRKVQAQRDYTVDWRFISLRLINSSIDYDAHFPPEYEAGHTAGLYAAFGANIFDSEPVPDDANNHGRRGTREFVTPTLGDAGLPAELAEALDDTSWDDEIRAESDEALALTGKDVGTPIIHFQPPSGWRSPAP